MDRGPQDWGNFHGELDVLDREGTCRSKLAPDTGEVALHWRVDAQSRTGSQFLYLP